jgi:hypothetical protein
MRKCHLHNWLRAYQRARRRWSEALEGKGNLLLRAVMVAERQRTLSSLPYRDPSAGRLRATALKRRAERPPTAYRMAPSEAYDEALMRLERVGQRRWRTQL